MVAKISKEQVNTHWLLCFLYLREIELSFWLYAPNPIDVGERRQALDE